MWIDQAEIYVRAGNGGHGCLSFRREKYIPRGGPDGGDGGHGGNVYAVATPGIETLMDFAGRHHWIAKNGLPGMGKNRTGAGGEDLYLKLPAGTLIVDRDTGVLIKDLSTMDEPILIAEGGKGGRGNARFARATHQTPREFETGAVGHERWLQLELKLIADVGIVGLPNAGKSTLLSQLSKAKPKIASYPFTTLRPQLGIAELPGHRRIVMADIPGLIEGAHEGAGLGDSFLQHIERTRIILHVVDVGTDLDGCNPLDAYRTIRNELTKFSSVLADKEELVVGNKIDLTGGSDEATALADEIGIPVLPVSAATRNGLRELMEQLWIRLQASRVAAQPPSGEASPEQEAPT